MGTSSIRLCYTVCEVCNSKRKFWILSAAQRQGEISAIIPSISDLDSMQLMRSSRCIAYESVLETFMNVLS